MVARANGTTVLHLAKDAVPTYRWAHPERQVMIRFGDLVRPFHDLNDTLGSESQTLAELRDLLLPKLLSGEIRVPEAEEIVEDIA